MHRLPCLLLLLLLESCVQQKSENLNAVVEGNWFLLDMKPETPLYDSSYTKMEDSISRIYTHKMIRLEKGGAFTDVDSLFNGKGKWLVVDNNYLAIAKAGKGFELFIGSFKGYDPSDQLLELRHKINRGVGNDSVPVIWQFKKIDSENRWFHLFSDSSNSWRKRPLTPESEATLQQKLSMMLAYYADYFELVSEESDFFMTWRIPLPIKFYAHGVGLKSLEKAPGFEEFFFDKADAEKALILLKNALRLQTQPYPKRDNYTLEYAAYLKILAHQLKGD